MMPETTASLIRSRRPKVLDDVSWDVWVLPRDLEGRAQWPPEQFRVRDTRIDLLTDLWRGGLGPATDLGPSPVRLNPFKAYSTRLANFLLLSEPMAMGEIPEEAVVESIPTPGEVNDLVDVAHDCLIDLSRFGGCVLLRVDGALAVPSPATWYPHMDGSTILSRPWATGESGDGEIDRLDLTVIADGMGRVETRWYSDQGTLGDVLEVMDLGPCEIEVVARDPREGIWGSAKYLEMWSIAYEVNRRLSRNSRLFDLFSGPIPVFQQSDVDTDVRFGVDADDDAAERQRKVLEGQLGILSEDSLHLPDSVLSVSYLQPNVQGTSYALTQVTDLREMLREMTGLPDLTGQTLSGEALKRLHIHFYAETRALQNSLRLAMERLLGEQIDWPHVFDGGLFAGPDPAMPGAVDSNPEAPPAPLVDTV